MAEFDFAQIVRRLGCEGPAQGVVKGFKQNSREVVPGDLFFAMKGETVDGHAFLRDAAVQGAVGAVVSKGYLGGDFGMKLLRVADVRGSLQELARGVQAERKTRIVGVTGSVGKTTTKEFIATLLEGKFRVAKTPGNANSQVGVPLSILNSAGDEEVFVMEMGMSEPHEIERLVSIAPPEVALITKIALAHAAFFPEGLKGIAAAKAEILSHPATRVGIVNFQAAAFDAVRAVGTCRKLTYGSVESDFALMRVEDKFVIREGEELSPVFSLPFAASHLVENFLGAAAVAREMGMQWEEILQQAQNLKLYMRRFERVEREGVVFINDSYNANLASMSAALCNLPAPEAGRKTIAVLGAMKELGEHTHECHYEVAKIALSHVDYLLCLGEECITMVDLFQKEGKPVEHFFSLDAIKRRVYELAEVGDVVLLKGSNSKKLWQVLEP